MTELFIVQFSFSIFFFIFLKKQITVSSVSTYPTMAPERTIMAHRPSQSAATRDPYTIMMKTEPTQHTRWRSYPPIRRLEPAQKKDESTSSPPIQPSSRRDYVAWSKRETHALVQWLELDDNFNAMKRNTARMLPMLSKHLQETVPGCFKTPKQCDHKIRNLKKCYKKVRVKLAESGRSYDTTDSRLREELVDQFPYFEQFERFMVDDHIVRHFPSALLKLAADGGPSKSNNSPPRKEESADEDHTVSDNKSSPSLVHNDKKSCQHSPIIMAPTSAPVQQQPVASPVPTLAHNQSQISPMHTPQSTSTTPANTTSHEFPDMSRFRSIRPKDGPAQCPIAHHKPPLADTQESSNPHLFNPHVNNINGHHYNNTRSSESQLQDFLSSKQLSHHIRQQQQQQPQQPQHQQHQQQQQHHQQQQQQQQQSQQQQHQQQQLDENLHGEPDYKKQKISSAPASTNNAANQFFNLFPQSLNMGSKGSLFSGLPENISKCPVKMDELDLGPKCPVGLDSSVGLFGPHGNNFGALASLSQIAKPIGAPASSSNMANSGEINGNINGRNGPVEENNPHGTLLNILKMMSKKPNGVDTGNLSSGLSQQLSTNPPTASAEDGKGDLPESSSSPQETAQILAEHIKTSLAKKEAVNRQKLYLNHLQQQIQRHTMRAEMLYNNGQVSRASKVMDKIDELELELHEVLSRPLNQF